MTHPNKEKNQSSYHSVSLLGKREPERKRTLGPSKIYKKSVSKSLVYRSLKIDRDGYVGFKVTYSGKGGKGNYNRCRVSIILIPEISLIRNYRAIAGAIARATHGEVYTCSYSAIDGLNSRIISLILDRASYRKSKIKEIDIVSQSSEILNLLRDRLSLIDAFSETVGCSQLPIETPALSESSGDILEDAPASSPDEIPLYESVDKKPSLTRIVRRRVNLIKVTGSRSVPDKNPGLFTKLIGAVLGKMGGLFRPSPERVGGVDQTKSVFEIQESIYVIDKKLSFDNPFHCDIMAKGMLSKQNTQ